MAFLLKAAHVVDPSVSLDEICDVLIEDDKIAQVGQNLTAPQVFGSRFGRHACALP